MNSYMHYSRSIQSQAEKKKKKKNPIIFFSTTITMDVESTTLEYLGSGVSMYIAW